MPGGPRPSYYTCRHTYEETLMDEIERAAALEAAATSASSDGGGGGGGGGVRCTSPYPGLVRVVSRDDGGDATSCLPLGSRHDPVYALQTLPDAVIVESESIKGLAREAARALLGSSSGDGGPAGGGGGIVAEDGRAASDRSDLRRAPRGSLSIHALVPGMLRGQPDPVMKRRADRVADEIGAIVRRGYAAARAPPKKNQDVDATKHHVKAGGHAKRDGHDDGNDTEEGTGERWVLQLLLLSPEVAAASLTRCESPWPDAAAAAAAIADDSDSLAASDDASFMSWPNWDLPGGLANVDIVERMPSSAYRKLLEAFRCLRRRPPPLSIPPYAPPPPMTDPSSWVVDLGACPGGWTAALRLMGCAVIAVDRTALDVDLMEDECVKFVKGDAFAFEPPWVQRRADDDRGRGGKGKGKGGPESDSDSDSSYYRSPPDSWMVSDVIAYPERVSEMLTRWCGGYWVRNVVVTVKFQGYDIPWDDLEEAMDAARVHGYDCRAKHFFNNKNEVTVMASERRQRWTGEEDGKASTSTRVRGEGEDTVTFLGRPMYPVSLPAPQR